MNVTKEIRSAAGKAQDEARHVVDEARTVAEDVRDAAVERRSTFGAIGAAVLLVAAAILALRDRRRRNRLRGAMRAAAHHAASAATGERSYDDVTLAQEVVSEAFRDAGAAKGHVSVNAVGGVVELRGQLPTDAEVSDLVTRVRDVAGVRDVQNLLHTPGTPPKHAPGRFARS